MPNDTNNKTVNDNSTGSDSDKNKIGKDTNDGHTQSKKNDKDDGADTNSE
jgi:hypothetical protein